MQASFRDIKADLLRRIRHGEWAPGGLFPGEAELAAAYGAARATVNRAMRELADDGLVERRRRAGTRVREAPLRQARFDIPLIRREIEDRGARYRYALVHTEEIQAPDWLRARLDLAVGVTVRHLLCLHFADETPYQVEDRWINLATLPQAATADFSSVGPNQWLLATVPWTSAEIALAAIQADATLAGHLGCAPGTALMQMQRSTWLDGRAVTFVRLTFRPGHLMTTRW